MAELPMFLSIYYLKSFYKGFSPMAFLSDGVRMTRFPFQVVLSLTYIHCCQCSAGILCYVNTILWFVCYTHSTLMNLNRKNLRLTVLLAVVGAELSCKSAEYPWHKDELGSLNTQMLLLTFIYGLLLKMGKIKSFHFHLIWDRRYLQNLLVPSIVSLDFKRSANSSF